MKITIMLSLLLICVCLMPAGMGAQQNPNIILISGDDVGWNDLGVYGHPVHTPSFDRMAAEGMRFNQFYVTTSSCSPSRASVWTGKYPHATGAENLHDPLPADQWVISGHLKGQGYYTANVGKLHLGERPAILAQYDLILPEVFKDGQKATDPSGIDEFLDRRPKDRPFFLGIGYTEAHRPFKHRTPIPQPHTPDKVEVPPYLADIPEVRQELVDYYDEINFMDASIGRLMQRLRDEGIEDNTVIFFFGDNGMPFPRAKTTLYDSGIRVPFLVKWPVRIPKGGVSNGLASSVDIAPTILEIAGVAIPADIQGASMLPALLDANNPGRTYVFAERNWHNFDDHAKAIRWKNLKYHRNFFPGEPYYPASDITDSASYQAMVRLLDMGRLNLQQTIQFLAIRPEEALYDLDKDPYEFQNLAYDPQYQADLLHLRQVMDQWLVDTHDTDPNERHYDNIINRTGNRLYQGRGIPRVKVDFEKLKAEQESEEVRLQNP